MPSNLFEFIALCARGLTLNRSIPQPNALPQGPDPLPAHAQPNGAHEHGPEVQSKGGQEILEVAQDPSSSQMDRRPRAGAQDTRKTLGEEESKLNRMQEGPHADNQPENVQSLAEGAHRSNSQRERLVKAQEEFLHKLVTNVDADRSQMSHWLESLGRPIPFSSADQATLTLPKSEMKGQSLAFKLKRTRENRIKAQAYQREWKSIATTMPLNLDGPWKMPPTKESSDDWYPKDEMFIRYLTRLRSHQAWNPKADLPRWDELRALKERIDLIKKRQSMPLHDQDKHVLEAEIRFLENEVRKIEFKIRVSGTL